MSEEKERFTLLSLMILLRDKELLSEEDFKTIDSVSRLGDAVLSSGLVSRLELEETGKELSEILSYLSRRIRDGSFTTTLVQDKIKEMAGDKFPSLVAYLTQEPPHSSGGE